jgi:uncharacterized membrane protein YeaQ/YmgE (transglycosylase-associated protein family)
MGFLAYLLLGGLVGWAAGHYFPGFTPSSKPSERVKQRKLIFPWTVCLGMLGAVTASYMGQILGFFTSGKMLEWGSAVIGSFVLPNFYLLVKRYK